MEKTIRINYEIPVSLKKRFDNYCQTTGMKKEKVCQIAIQEFLDKDDSIADMAKKESK